MDDEHPSPHRHRDKRLRQTTDSGQASIHETGLMRNEVDPDSASFVGSASGIHFIRSVYRSLAERRSAAYQSAPTAPCDIVPGEEDTWNSPSLNCRAAPLWHAEEVDIGQSDNISTSVSFESLVDWSQSYFDIWHPAFPLLHAPTVLEIFEDFARRGVPQENSPELIIVKAIMSISIADRRQHQVTRVVPRSLVFESFEEALDCVHRAITAPPTTKALQSVVCVQLFLLSMLRLNMASRLGGFVLMLAYQLGLHRCPARFPSFTIHGQQLRRRLFWSIYIINRHISQALGLPLTIRDEDFDVCYPDRELHADVNPIAPGSGGDVLQIPHLPQSPIDDRLRLLTLLAMHAEIKGLTMELRNKSIKWREESIDETMLINTKIGRLGNEVEDAIEQGELRQTPFNPLHQAVLHTLKHETIIALNRPLLATAKGSTTYLAALQACVGASRSLIVILSGLARSPSNSGAQNQAQPLPMFWPSFTSSVWMSAFIIMYAAMEGEVEQDVAFRCTDRALQILKTLSARGIAWPSACAVAISDLRSSMVEHYSRHAASHPGALDGSASIRGDPSSVADRVPVLPQQRDELASVLRQSSREHAGRDRSMFQESTSQTSAAAAEIAQNPSSITDWDTIASQSFAPPQYAASHQLVDPANFAGMPWQGRLSQADALSMFWNNDLESLWAFDMPYGAAYTDAGV